MNIVDHYNNPIKPVYVSALELGGKVTITPVAIGAIITAVYFIYKYIKALRLYKEALPLDIEFFTQWKRKHFLYRDYIIKKSDYISSPLTYGFLKPAILLPKSILTIDMRDIDYILLHEWNHIRRWDTLKKWALVIMLCAHWFNPLVWLMFALANRDIELCCDEDLVRMIGENKKKEYANLLINMEKKRVKLNPLCSGFRNNYMKERIVSLMKVKKVTTSMILVASILVVGATTIFGTSGLEKSKVVDISIPNLYGRTYEEASPMLKELGLSFIIEE